MDSICSRGLNNNTLVHEIDIHKGSQWVLFVATVVYGLLKLVSFIANSPV